MVDISTEWYMQMTHKPSDLPMSWIGEAYTVNDVGWYSDSFLFLNQDKNKC